MSRELGLRQAQIQLYFTRLSDLMNCLNLWCSKITVRSTVNVFCSLKNRTVTMLQLSIAWLVGKRVINFLLVLIELFSLALMVKALWADIGQNFGVQKVDGSLWAQISGEEGTSTNDFWHQKTRVPGYHVALFASSYL